ncbi:MAG TPA: hypothetical protein VM054_02625 [bacterium]|nr:hypothetical protein [bacterium]
MTRNPQRKKKGEQPDDEVFTDQGPWGDVWRYVKLTFSLAFNFGFAVFVGYILGEMADDTFLGAYDTVFTYIGLGLGLLGALVGTRKRMLRFGHRQQDLLVRRHGISGEDRSSSTTVAVGFLALFAGLCQASGFIYTVELGRAGALWLLWTDLVLVGGGLIALGMLVLLRRPVEVKLVRWLFLVPIASGVALFLFSLAGGAKLNVAVTLMLMALAPLVGMFVAFFEGEKKDQAA